VQGGGGGGEVGGEGRMTTGASRLSSDSIMGRKLLYENMGRTSGRWKLDRNGHLERESRQSGYGGAAHRQGEMAGSHPMSSVRAGNRGCINYGF
jgi:hypothetical protein